ncbi:MAG: cysteine dioxygenase [Rhodospirillaceae bacterium]|nr:cysteine dioxygenase [Rhodospirillaceae bacterium]
MNNAQPFVDFLRRMTALVEAKASTAEMLREVPVALKPVLAGEAWLPKDLSVPNPDKYQQYLLYADPKGRFSVVSFVWGPGQYTPIHDHTVWGAVGQLRGQEISTNYARTPTGLRVSSVDTLTAGETISFAPEGGDIHEVRNGSDQVSISIHVYGADIGRIERHIFDLDGAVKPFISGYSPGPVPQWPL